MYSATLGGTRYVFPNLKTLLAKASPQAVGRRARRRRGGERRRAGRGADGARRPAAEGLPQRGGRPLRRRRRDAADRRRRRLRALAPVASLTVGELRDWLLSDAATARSAGGAVARPDAGDGRRRQQALPQPGSDRDRRQARGRDALPQHHRPARGGCRRGCSPTIRPTIPRASLASIIDGLLLGCGDAVIGVNPASDSPQRCAELLVADRRRAAAARHPDPVLRADPCHDDDRPDRSGRAGRSRLPVDRRHRGDQSQLRHHARSSATRRARRRCRSSAGRSATT